MKPAQQGAALLLVLWASSLLALILGSYAFMVRLQAWQAQQLIQHTQAGLMAESVLAETIFDLWQRAQTPADASHDGHSRRSWYGGMAVDLGIQDERGKIDLIHAPPVLLQAWLRQCGASDAAAVAEQLIQWREAVLGEDDASPSADLDLDHLAQLLGVPATVWSCLQPDASLWLNQPYPMQRFASASVRAVLLGLRSSLSPAEMVEAGDASVSDAGRIQSISIQVHSHTHSLARLQVTIQLQPSATHLYTVLQWQERSY